MNNNVKKSFLFRHAEGAVQPDGFKAYEEDFYLNQQSPLLADRDIFYIFAYGECFWRSSYQQKNYGGRDFWSFEFLTEGDALFICDGIRYNVKPGDVYIMKPGKKIFVKPGPSGFLRKRCILMKSHLLNYISLNGRLNGVDFVHIKDSSRINDIYDRIRDLILSAPDNFLPENLSIQAYTLLLELNRLAMPLQYPDILRNALNIINNASHLAHTLEGLSTACNTSISTLSRLFRDHIGVSPMNYIIDQRLEHAKLMIYMKDMPLKEIAQRCGYHSESFLSRAFKKKFGVSPLAFRKKN